jgi:hypothetical protein
MVEFVTEKIILPRGPALVPASGYDLEQFDKVPFKRKYRTRIIFNRTDPLHRFYWGLISVVAEGLGYPATTLHVYLKRDAGLIAHVFPDGALILKSIKKSEMDETEFLAYVRAVKDIIFVKYLPDLRATERRDVFARVEQITGEACPF